MKDIDWLTALLPPDGDAPIYDTRGRMIPRETPTDYEPEF